MWRFKIFERDWHLWQWRTDRAPSGFWVKHRGPFMWWGKNERKRHGREIQNPIRVGADS